VCVHTEMCVCLCVYSVRVCACVCVCIARAVRKRTRPVHVRVRVRVREACVSIPVLCVFGVILMYQYLCLSSLYTVCWGVLICK